MCSLMYCTLSSYIGCFPFVGGVDGGDLVFKFVKGIEIGLQAIWAGALAVSYVGKGSIQEDLAWAIVTGVIGWVWWLLPLSIHLSYV